jgi:ATP-dependent RNA helicase DDX49/DBP8
MPLKRKLEPNIAHDDTPKRMRFDEWLSDAKEGSDSSKNENDGNQLSDDDSASDSQPVIEQKVSKEIKCDDSDSNSARVRRIDEVRSTRFLTSTVKRLENSVSADKTRNSTMESSNFMELGVHPSLVASLAAMSIRKPTSVQASCIPPLLKGDKYRIRGCLYLNVDM